ncbi:MAG: alkaline shock response membrane anchor protein AmaP [Actinobacteria bacterium]|nr:alkaline shock response membrane anchor protein AmaP [Actinomycetota bacterium]
MNIFNRIIMILLLLFLIISSIVIAVNIFADLFSWSDIFDRILSFIDGTNPYIVLGIFIAITSIGIVILVFEFYRRRIKTTNVVSSKEGRATITLRSASQMIAENLGDIDHINNIKVRVIPKSGGTIINIVAMLTKGINVSKKTQEVIKEVNAFATEDLGLKVVRTNFTVTGFNPKSEYATVDELEEEEEDRIKEIPKEPENIGTLEDKND